MVVAQAASRGNLKAQYYAAISGNIILMGYGVGMGWLTTAIPLLQSNETPLETGPMTTEQLSWAGSIISIGALIGNFLFGYCTNAMGSRNAVFFLGIPQMSGWLFMYFGRQIWDIIISRFLVGFVIGGLQICNSIYIAEIADNDIRGQLATIYSLMRGVGVLMAFTLGAYYDYLTCSLFFMGVTGTFLISFVCLPSTPQYFLQKNKLEEAEKSFQFYKGYGNRKESVSVMAQFDKMKHVAKVLEEDTKLTTADLWGARKGFFLAFVYAASNIMCAGYIFQTYGSTIIADSGTRLSTEWSSISFAVVQLIGTYVSTVFIDSIGRRVLLIISMAGSTIGHFVMAAYVYAHHNGYDIEMLHWTPIICMASIIFISSIGIVPLTAICTVECFPVKVRSFGLTFGNVMLNVIGFVVAKLYPITSEVIGLSNCGLIFGVSCLLSMIYMILYSTETKGKELNDIESRDENESS